MYIDKNSIQINNISMGTYLKNAVVSYPKLWSSDSGRNLAGRMTGTLVGIFPKFELTFRKLSQTDLSILAPIFDSSRQYLRYHDDASNSYKTIETYTGDWSTSYNRLGTADGVKISFISVGRRV